MCTLRGFSTEGRPSGEATPPRDASTTKSSMGVIATDDPLMCSLGLLSYCEPFIFLHGAPDPLQRALI